MNIYKPKVNKISNIVGLFCNARDEKNIKEWAAHHLLIGFDIIIIFDHKSVIPLSNVFSNFDKRVIIIRTESETKNVKIELMNKAVSISRNLNMDWFIYLDADEFLILNNFRNVKHMLNAYSYADSLGINWLMFGSNNLIETPEGLILENYTKSNLNTDHHVKSFVRPNEIVFCDNPHFYHIRRKLRSLGILFNIVTAPQCFSKITLPYYKTPAYIAHYVYQSEETYLKRKISIPADDGSSRTNMGKDMHNHYNDTINLQPQRYVNRIKAFLERYN